MTELEKRMMEKMGLTEDDFTPQPTTKAIADDAYLKAEYNSILLETMMEE